MKVLRVAITQDQPMGAASLLPHLLFHAKELIYLGFNFRKTSTLPPCNAATSSLHSIFFLSTKVREILHPEFLLHFLSFVWHLSILPITAAMGEPECAAAQDRATVSWQPSYSSQNCSNRHSRCDFTRMPLGRITIGLWSDCPQTKECTFVAGKRSTQSVVLIALLRRFQMPPDG